MLVSKLQNYSQQTYYQCEYHGYMGNYATVELGERFTSQDVGQLSGATSNIQNQLDAIVSSQWTTNSSNNIHFADKVGIGISDPTSKLEVIGDIVQLVILLVAILKALMFI